MADKNNQHEQWIFRTTIILGVLSMVYFIVLIHQDTGVFVVQYLSNNPIILTVISIFVVMLIMYRKLELYSHKCQRNKVAMQSDSIKAIEQIIWRNRYVLQSRKVKSAVDVRLDNPVKWLQVKQTFCEETVFTVVSEQKVSFEDVSDLIDKSLAGLSYSGIPPLTYHIENQ